MITVSISSSVTLIDDCAFRSTSLRNVLYKGTPGDWVTLSESIGKKNEKLSSANKYCYYVDGTPIAALYENEGTFFIDAINCTDTENAVVYLAIYDKDGCLIRLLPTDPFQKEIKHRSLDYYYDLTCGTAVAMIWDKDTLTPLAKKTVRNYNFVKDDNYAENEDMGGGAEVGGGTGSGAEVGGGTGGKIEIGDITSGVIE